MCPAFNRSRLLGRAIDSVLRQELADFELVVVNDGSTDDTRGVVSHYKDKRIVYVEHETNKGYNAAINSGINMARGKYVAKLDDDDELSPFALKMAADAFRESARDEIHVLFFNCIDVETRLISGRTLPENTIVHYEDLLCQKLRGDYWVVVEKSVLPEGRPFKDELNESAGVLWLRILRGCDGFYIRKTAYLAYRRHGRPRMSSFEANSRNLALREHTTKFVLDEFGRDMEQACRKVYSKQIAKLALYQLLNGKSREARLNMILSLRNHLSAFGLGLLALTVVGRARGARFVYENIMKGYFARTFY